MIFSELRDLMSYYCQTFPFEVKTSVTVLQSVISEEIPIESRGEKITQEIKAPSWPKEMGSPWNSLENNWPLITLNSH